MTDNLPEIKADIVFANKALQFRPPLEELKAKYYKEIKSFISIPITFQGLGGNPEVYRKMPDKNSDGLYTVYSKAEELFGELKELLLVYKPWVVLGKVNIDSLVEENVKDVADYEANFKMIRQKRKDIEKLQEQQKVHCFSISTSPIKSTIEDQLQRLNEALIVTLKTSVKTDIDYLDEFLKNANAKLTQRPQNVEEIAKAQKEALDVAGQKEKTYKQYQNLQEKTKILKNITGASPNLSVISDKWENFEVSVEAFAEVIEQQREVVKQDIQKRGEDLAISLDKFASRWTALKPKTIDELDMQSAVENAEKVKE